MGGSQDTDNDVENKLRPSNRQIDAMKEEIARLRCSIKRVRRYPDNSHDPDIQVENNNTHLDTQIDALKEEVSQLKCLIKHGKWHQQGSHRNAIVIKQQTDIIWV